jgi:hypothetical protein
MKRTPQRDATRQALGGFINRIVILPGEGLLQVVGNLGEMLTAAGGRTGAAAVGYGGCGGRDLKRCRTVLAVVELDELVILTHRNSIVPTVCLNKNGPNRFGP